MSADGFTGVMSRRRGSQTRQREEQAAADAAAAQKLAQARMVARARAEGTIHGDFLIDDHRVERVCAAEIIGGSPQICITSPEEFRSGNKLFGIGAEIVGPGIPKGAVITEEGTFFEVPRKFITLSEVPTESHPAATIGIVPADKRGV